MGRREGLDLMGLRDNALGRITAAQDAAAAQRDQQEQANAEAYADLLRPFFPGVTVTALGYLSTEEPERVRRNSPYSEYVTSHQVTRYRVQVDDVVIAGVMNYNGFSSTKGQYQPFVETTCPRCGNTSYAEVHNLYYRDKDTLAEWTFEIGKSLKRETVCAFCRVDVGMFCATCGKKQYDA